MSILHLLILFLVLGGGLYISSRLPSPWRTVGYVVVLICLVVLLLSVFGVANLGAVRVGG